MKSEDILDAVGEINDASVLEARKKPHHWGRLAAVAACLLVVIGGIFAGTHGEAAPEAVQITQAAAAEEAGPRKFLNYNGCQYVFLQQGAAFDLPRELVGKPLGTLEYEIIIGREDHLKDDFAATFAVGGTLYELTTYDPAFRIAVQWEDAWYLCEKTDHLGDNLVDAAVYFETADFLETVSVIEIRDHMGTEVLKTVKGKKAEKLLQALSRMDQAELSGDQYQQIGEAQRAGKSFLLSLQLPDGTSYELYVIPSLSIGMLGNNRYYLPGDFADQFGAMFDKLKQAPMSVQ